jgi:hypothetical protein
MSWLVWVDDAVAREDRVAVMPVRIGGVHAVGAVRVDAGGKEVELRSGRRVARVAGQTLVAVLHLLQEDDVGVDRLAVPAGRRECAAARECR